MDASTEPSDTELYRFRFGDAEFDESRRELRVAGLTVEIEPRPLLVLAALLRRADAVLSRHELIDYAWEGRPTVNHTLSNAILKLRKALRDEQGQRIVTIQRAGYKLIGPVERVAIGQRLMSLPQLSAGESVPGKADFELDQQLSVSATSEVWLARQRATREKRIFKFSRNSEQLASLKREVTLFRVLRDALGERKDFVRILDWNFIDPPYHLECEYAGENLPAWAGREQRFTHLTLDERLALFLQIADAVAAAHRVGVLHKDLKPTNVLVATWPDGGWQLRVADFGSGGLLEPERLKALGLTRLGLTAPVSAGQGALAGTPLYLAPELILGAAPTVQSDVYALGLMLYQFAIADLGRPIAPGWENDIKDELLRQDIAAATDGQVLRRLSSVSELIERLRALDARRAARERLREIDLRDAQAQRILERARTRRPWLIAALASLVAGLIFSAASYHRQGQALQKAEQARARTQAINSFLNDDVLGELDLAAPGAGRGVITQQLLSRAAEQAAQRFVNDPLTLASLNLSLGKAYFGLGNYQSAASLQSEAFGLLTQLAGPGDLQTLNAEYTLARSLDMINRHADARLLLDHADQNAGAQLAEASMLSLLAHWTRAGNAIMQMQPATALVDAVSADRIRQIVAPNDIQWLVRTRSDLAWCQVRLNGDAEALETLQPLLSPDYTPQRVGIVDWAKFHLDLGIAYRNLGRFELARQVLSDTLQEVTLGLGGAHYATGVVWSHLASVYLAQGHWDEAMAAAEHARSILLKTAGEQSPATLSAQGDIAILEYLTGQYDQALIDLQAVHEALTGAVGSANPLTQTVDFYLAAALNHARRPADAWALIAGLNADALTAGDAGTHWDTRLQSLKDQIQQRQAKMAGELAVPTHVAGGQ